VREGLFDAVYTNASYHIGEIAAGVSLDFCSASSKEMRAAGLLRSWMSYRERRQMSYIFRFDQWWRISTLSQKKIDKADLSGLKVRAAQYSIR
jgi:hypothetical protein